MKRVVVHIDRLVLKGVRHGDRQALVEGLKQELGRLLANPATARQMAARSNVEQLNVRGVRLAPVTPPAEVGIQSVRGIAREIKS